MFKQYILCRALIMRESVIQRCHHFFGALKLLLNVSVGVVNFLVKIVQILLKDRCGQHKNDKQWRTDNPS
ncbi:Uncharacterised protein [Vibrio cholerae]|nr:Uncharacterised protein [Vibrio cholerae]CSC38976.1 Uncharacterised protein [Vibrio cholerae]